MFERKNASILALVLLMNVAAAATPSPAAAGTAAEAAPKEGKTLANVDQNGVILEGYDTVAFHTEKKPVLGEAQFQSKWNGAIYHFASAANKALFDADPAKYAPQYGAFCAYAVSVNRLRPIDIHLFHFVEGRLMFQHSQKAFDLYHQDVAGNTVKADGYWPKLVTKKGGKWKAGKFDQPAK